MADFCSVLREMIHCLFFLCFLNMMATTSFIKNIIFFLLQEYEFYVCDIISWKWAMSNFQNGSLFFDSNLVVCKNLPWINLDIYQNTSVLNLSVQSLALFFLFYIKHLSLFSMYGMMEQYNCTLFRPYVLMFFLCLGLLWWML